eukprot:COSAG02_NODE_20261_length_839_cov_1.515520_2_plen_125_part_01
MLDCRRARQGACCAGLRPSYGLQLYPWPLLATTACCWLAWQAETRRAAAQPHSTQPQSRQLAASGQAAVARRPVVVVVAVVVAVVAVVVVAAMEGRGGSRRGGRSVVSVNGGTVTVSPATAEAGP